MTTTAKPGAPTVRVCSFEELERDRFRVVAAEGRTILVIHEHGEVFALDNRCPHMGFPLSRGSVRDGILTCPAWSVTQMEKQVADWGIETARRDLKLETFEVCWFRKTTPTLVPSLAHRADEYVSAAVDFLGLAERGRVWLRADIPLTWLAETALHETRHVWQFCTGMTADIELDAAEYARRFKHLTDQFGT